MISDGTRFLPGFPRKGWSLSGSSDNGDASHCCDACAFPRVRYVHTIDHPDHDSMDVGCCCATHLTEDYVTPVENEKDLKKRARNKNTWGDREWKTSKKGNTFLKINGMVLLARDFNNRWRLSYKFADSNDWIQATGQYQTLDAAKMAAFDLAYPV
jgi:hypothetical protein